jgi:hypothetical protein
LMKASHLVSSQGQRGPEIHISTGCDGAQCVAGFPFHQDSPPPLGGIEPVRREHD